MENIVSILSGLGVEIPQELVPALHKEIAENYKTCLLYTSDAADD